MTAASIVRSTGSIVGSKGFSSYGSRALQHRLSSCGTWAFFPDQGFNWCLLHWQVDSLHWATRNCKWKWKSLSRVWLFETPWTVVHGILQARILEWVAFPFSRGSSQPRDRSQVSRIAGGFFTNWVIREAQWATREALNRYFSQENTQMSNKLKMNSGEKWNSILSSCVDPLLDSLSLT